MTNTSLNLRGVHIDEAVAKDVFYGFRLDPLTGAFSIEVIAGGQGVVRLPSDTILDANDYRQWVFTRAALDFAFSGNGHLEMTIL